MDSERKLSPAQLKQVRRLLWLGIPHREIAQRFGVSSRCIGQIKRGLTYREGGQS